LPLKVIGHESLGEPFTLSLTLSHKSWNCKQEKKHKDNNKKELGEGGGVAKV